MKKIIFTLLVAIAIQSNAQILPVNPNTGMVEFERIIQAPEMTADEIYLKVIDWFGETFRNPESAITFHNRETGKINGRYIAAYDTYRQLGQQYYVNLLSEISIEIREGRLRVLINDFRTPQTEQTIEQIVLNSRGEVRRNYQATPPDINNKTNAFLDSLESYLTQVSDQDDW